MDDHRLIDLSGEGVPLLPPECELDVICWVQILTASMGLQSMVHYPGGALITARMSLVVITLS